MCAGEGAVNTSSAEVSVYNSAFSELQNASLSFLNRTFLTQVMGSN